VADDTLTPRQAAELLGVTVRTVQRWIADGRLPAERVGGRLRLSRSSLTHVSERSAAGPERAAIRSLLIANRGEIVGRIARTARRLDIRTLGVHAPDEPPPRGVDATSTIGSYLDGEAIVRAALDAGADAVHPGYGFLSENAAFAAAVQAAGLTWVGPPPSAIAAMGDKAEARRTAARQDVPVLPGYDGSEQDEATLKREAGRIGLPLLVKPAAGGGGKGMRVVRRAEDLPESLAAARREAARAFGDERLVLERLLEGPRHVEIQVLFDGHGNAVHLGERDCSSQRRNQKIVEEAPGPAVTPELRERLGAAALAVGRAVGYVNAGTVEFLLANDGSFYFLEMNTRLQVEHPVTEAVTGRDLVADQLRIADGEKLGFGQDAVRLRGHSIEARFYAEDPEAGFLPATGEIALLHWPEALRVDAGIAAGSAVTDRYDPMLAKLVAHGATRDEALRRLRDGLEATHVLGVRTNLRFLRWLLDQSVMRDGQMRTDTIAGLQLPEPAEPTPATWEAAALAVTAAGMTGPGAWGGGWRMNASPVVRLRHGDQARSVDLEPPPARPGPAAVGLGQRVFVDVEGQSLEFHVDQPPTIEEAVRHAASHREGQAVLTAPMPGRVISVRVAQGASVHEHATVVVLEAMKMEHTVVAPLSGTVTRLAVSEGQQVQRGDVLAEVSA
jgi:acetyl-CoA/propionyl-CoA carboxylase biotin carboxyl carrier protein